MNLQQLDRISERLLQHKRALEDFLYRRECTLFACEEVITLYDLTNTDFEGSARGNANAALGHSKEKRSACPLVTLALVLDASGFPKRSEVLEGNAREPKTLAQMVGKLTTRGSSGAPTVVLDAGIATEENIAWLTDNGYRYVVVSRRRHRQFDEEQAQRIVNTATGEIELYCHSSQREEKEKGIGELFTKRLEEAVEKLAAGLHKKGTVKRYDKVMEKIGRLKQRYARVARYYAIGVKQDTNTGKAIAIHWQRNQTVDDTLPGVYCLRTNHDDWNEATLGHTYTMLTDLEAVFPSLKSELGLRPVFHHKTDRLSAHLLSSGPHHSASAQGLRYSLELGRDTPTTPRPGSCHRRAHARRRKKATCTQSYTP